MSDGLWSLSLLLTTFLFSSKRSKPPHDKVAQSKPAVGYVTQTHKRYTSKDRPLLKTWEQAIEKGADLGKDTLMLIVRRVVHSLLQNSPRRKAFDATSPRAQRPSWFL